MVERRAFGAILITGPTASGKSALAIRLAARLGGLVVNADSMQVYRDLRIITARPTPEDERTVPHALFGSVDGATNHSVSLWLADAEAALGHARRQGLMPIFVGGTGLYFKALTQGLSEIPRVPEAVRAEMRAWASERDPQSLHRELAMRDPSTAARLRPTDPQRLLRALEVFESTGQSLVSFQARRAPPIIDVENTIAVALEPDRDRLRAAIESRFDTMMDRGAMEEVRRLSQRRLDPALPIMRAHGVPPLLAHLSTGTPLGAAIDKGKADTRRYVKRQGTFTRNQLPAFRPVVPERAEAEVMDYLDAQSV
jgi:tRNA dimethylallyltransferase